MVNLKADDKIEDYTVIAKLGEGGMSNVYRARDDVHDRDVTLKFPHDDMLGDPASYERFTREVKIGKTLDHPNIQKLYDLRGEKFQPFMVLEYLPGCTLRNFLREEHKKGWNHHEAIERAISFGKQIGGAISYAHEHKVFHRDLKPENIIVTSDGTAKVMDFGIAFIEGARRITWGSLSHQVGTPDYMAPEQIKGNRGDSRTDIYAVGMILYELVCGRLPYKGDNSLAVMSQHVTMPAPRLHNFCHEVPPALEETIMKAIRRNPAHRWPSMHALVFALEQPETVDAAALRAERDAQEVESSGRLNAHTSAGVPVWQVALWVIGIFGAMIAIALLSVVLQHHH